MLELAVPPSGRVHPRIPKTPTRVGVDGGGPIDRGFTALELTNVSSNGKDTFLSLVLDTSSNMAYDIETVTLHMRNGSEITLYVTFRGVQNQRERLMDAGYSCVYRETYKVRNTRDLPSIKAVIDKAPDMPVTLLQCYGHVALSHHITSLPCHARLEGLKQSARRTHYEQQDQLDPPREPQRAHLQRLHRKRHPNTSTWKQD